LLLTAGRKKATMNHRDGWMSETPWEITAQARIRVEVLEKSLPRRRTPCCRESLVSATSERSPEATNPNEWVDMHADRLFRYALTRLRRRQDAEDAVQETLLAALQAHKTFRGDSTERTWLMGILRNKIVDRLRLVTRDSAIEALPVGEMDEWCGKTDRWLHPPKSWSGDPGKLSEDAEFWQQVGKCFGALPERQAQIFALRTFDDMEAEDICEQTGVSKTNLWVLLHRARTSLRACLEKSWFTSESTPLRLPALCREHRATRLCPCGPSSA